MTREEFERQRVAMGLTAEEAQILIDKYDILFTDRNGHTDHSFGFLRALNPLPITRFAFPVNTRAAPFQASPVPKCRSWQGPANSFHKAGATLTAQR